MAESLTTALSFTSANVHKRLAKEVGFCQFEEHKDPLAAIIIHRINRNALENEQSANRLYRGREALTIEGFARSELLKAIERYRYTIGLLEKVADETAPSAEPSHMMAAE